MELSPRPGKGTGKGKGKGKEVEVGAYLAWSNLSVTVSWGGTVNTLIDGLTGYAEPGTITAVMGPSGSGKSTLLDTLAGRLSKNVRQTGDIFLNGKRQGLAYGVAAYVTQNDTLLGTLTVLETLTFSAFFRLPAGMSRNEKMGIVDSAINDMGLRDVVHTPVGNWHMKGLSGGERRRVTIALELLTRPRLLLLDEPTSGLDSAAAFFVTTALKNLARDGRTIITSLHQPCSEVFELFDILLLISGGKTVYFGSAAEAHQHFEDVGLPCPQWRNPADHFLRAINSDFDHVSAAIPTSAQFQKDVAGGNHDIDLEQAQPLRAISTSQRTEILVANYSTSSYFKLAEEKARQIAEMNGPMWESAGTKANALMQCYTLTRRSFTNMSRDLGYYWLRLLMYVALCLAIGTIYYDVGTDYDAIQARASSLSFVIAFLTFMAIGGFPSFVEEMKVFSRERLNGHYGVGAFVMSNTLSSLPFLLLIACVSGAAMYFLVGLHPGIIHFSYFVLVIFATTSAVEGMMMAISAVIPNFLMGIIVGAGIQGFLMLNGGFFRLPRDLPKPIWRYPMSYIAFHTYGFQGLYENDFLGLTFKSKGYPLNQQLIRGEDIVYRDFQVPDGRGKWMNLGIVFIQVFLYRALFYITVKLSENLRPALTFFSARRRGCKVVPRSPHQTLTRWKGRWLTRRTSAGDAVLPLKLTLENDELLPPIWKNEKPSEAAACAWIRSQIPGRAIEFRTAFGTTRLLTYADHTASGQPLLHVENFIAQTLLPFYGNTHTEDSHVGKAMTYAAHEASDFIKHCLGATRDEAIFYCGSGTTAALKRLQECLGVCVPSILTSRVGEMLVDAEKWVVFVGPYEHHSNLLSWRESLAEVIEIPMNDDGSGLDMRKLRAALKDPNYRSRPKLGSFSAASNVTGLVTDTRAIACILHEHGAFACFDFAASGPYVRIDMRAGQLDGYDAVVLSPHKFLGGPGSPGILVMTKDLYLLKDFPPSTSGGGTVDYVNMHAKDTIYAKDIEQREDAGTPPILQKVRAALAFWVKELIGHDLIDEREHYFITTAIRRLQKNPYVHILGNTEVKRCAILSFLVYSRELEACSDNIGESRIAVGKPLHCRFVVRLLNDLFGIQARAGCACAAPYGHYLLNIDDDESLAFREAIRKGHIGVKPGWARLSFGFFITDDEFHFILSAIEFVADQGQRFLPLYDFDWYTGEWTLKDSCLNTLVVPLPIAASTAGECHISCKFLEEIWAEESGSLQLHGNETRSIYVELEQEMSASRKYAAYLADAINLSKSLEEYPSKRPSPPEINPDLIHFRA